LPQVSPYFIGTIECRDLIFKTRGYERMRIAGMGRYIGIGTQDPQAMLHISNPRAPESLCKRDDPNDDGEPDFLRFTEKLIQLNARGVPDGFDISFNGKNIIFKHHEEANFSLEGPGGGLTIAPDGNIGVGTTTPLAKLDVDGSFKAQSATLTGALSAQSAKIAGRVCAKEVIVSLSGSPCWPDFVFDKEYKLPTLSEVEQFITENKHLPDVPSAAEVEANGVNIGEMNAVLIRKVEELTLYIIEQEKLMKKLEKQLSEIENKKGGE